MTIVAALSNPVPGTFAIQLENDNSINNASEVLKSNIPGISIIEYKSLKYDLIAHRIITPTIWIGHGDEEGIATKEELISWEDFSEEISVTPANDIVLACHSSNLLEQTSLTQKDVFTFNGEIDSTFGALVTALLITQNERVYDAAIDHIFALYTKEVEYNPLPILLDDGGGGGGGISDREDEFDYPDTYEEATTDYSYVFAKLSGVELLYHVVMLGVLILNIIIGVACASAELNFITTWAIEFWVTGLASFIFSLALFGKGLMTEDQLVEDIFGCFNDGGEAFVQAWNDSTAGDIDQLLTLLIVAGVVLIGEAILDIFCGGAGTIIRTVAAVAMVLLFIYDFADDCSDIDTVVG